MSENDLRALPNIGPAIARTLMRLGIERPDDLRGQTAEQLYRRLCDMDRRRHDGRAELTAGSYGIVSTWPG